MHQWPPGVLLSTDLLERDISLRTASRAVERGELIRLKRGAYCSRTSWDAASASERHRWRVLAVAATYPRAVFSHWSAAAIHGLPIIGPWPSDVHVAADRASGGRSERGIRRHCRGLPVSDVTRVGALAVTAIERTVVDLAAVQPFRFALSPADHVLRGELVTREHLVDRCAALTRGRRRALRVIEFANPEAASPGESLSRGVIHELGFPTPRLQTRHVIDGAEYFTDFEWPEHQVIGEFDGLGKYLRDEYLRGRTTAEAVLDEKRRENRLRRATGSTVARWEWADALKLAPLRAILIEAGLPAPVARM